MERSKIIYSLYNLSENSGIFVQERKKVEERKNEKVISKE